MDRLQNQRNIQTIKRLLALVLTFCFLFLMSCAKQTADNNASLSTLSSETETSAPEKISSIVEDETSGEKISDSKKDEISSTSKDKSSEKESKTEKKKGGSASTTTSKPSVKTTKPTTKDNRKYCYLSIECKTVLQADNYKNLDLSKKAVVPSDGIILKKAKVEYFDGDKAYDILKRACRNNVCSHSCQFCKNYNNSIQFESVPSAFGTYIRGIHFLYEKDCGTSSGWMYRINGVFARVSVDSSEQKLKENDYIEFLYTCTPGDLGKDSIFD